MELLEKSTSSPRNDMTFPYDTVPDGAVMAPHHLYIGFGLLVVAILIVWDDRPADPVATLLSALAVFFGFLFVWPYYAVVGAAMTLFGLAAAPVAAYVDRDVFLEARSTKTAIGMAVAGWLIAVDDVIEHAFGIPTPLDLLFNEVLRPLLPSTADVLPL